MRYGAITRRMSTLVLAALSGTVLTMLPATTAHAATLSATLPDGQVLHAGDSVWSPDGRYALYMQGDGNLVEGGPNGVVWAAGTNGSGASYAGMQGDGNFVLYTSSGSPVCASNTWGYPGAYLAVQNDGNVVVYTPAGRALWASQSNPGNNYCHGTIPARPTTQYSSVLPSNQVLNPGDSVWSSDGRYALYMQADGNLVEGGPNGVVWAAGTNGSGVNHAGMQGDGNFVLYTGSGNAVCATNTWAYPGSYLAVQTDGNVVVYTPAGRALWATQSNPGNNYCHGTIPQRPGTQYHGVLADGQVLYSDDSVVSPDGRYSFVLQTDGNIVEYGPNGVVWAGGSNGSGATLAGMQGDGNFVLYNGSGHAVCATGTDGHPGASLSVQNDNNVVVYLPSGQALWASQSHAGNNYCNGGPPPPGPGRADQIASLASKNVGRHGCDANTLGGTGYPPSCANGKVTQDWCADFAKWVWASAGVKNTGMLTPAVYSFYAYGVKYGTIVTKPSKGDVMLLGVNTATKYASHMAVVVNVNTNGSVTVVGGNEGWGSGKATNLSNSFVQTDTYSPKSFGTFVAPAP